MNLHVRDLPDDLHELLVRRAAAQGMSLRQYVVRVLADHAALPTMDEWLDEVSRLEPARDGGMSGADAVRQARMADDDQVVSAASRR